MNCFEWQSNSSDYLDGILASGAKKEADEHLASCEACSERHKHFRLILSSIIGQPRSALPVPIRKAPLTAVLPRTDASRAASSRWERMPWYIRTALEGTGIVLLILVGTTAGPRIRAIYERNLEKSLNDFSDSLTTYTGTEETPKTSAPLARAETAAQAGPGKGDEYSGEGESSEEDSEEVTVNEGDEEIHVGKSEIWRFNMKTDSPHEVRPKIVQMLTSVNVPTGTPGFGGIEAPGGIQFDLLVPSSSVPSIKRELQKIAPPSPDGLASRSPMAQTFTWYKNKSRRKLPEGQTRVVIWLSQM